MYNFAIGYKDKDVIRVVSGEKVSIEEFEVEYGKLNNIVFITLVEAWEMKINGKVFSRYSEL